MEQRGLDSAEVRRAFWRAGGDYAKAARALSCGVTTVRHHVERMNREHPIPVDLSGLKVPGASKEDIAAINEYLRLTVRERAGLPKPVK